MSHQFKNKDEENKFLTLSEIFTDVKPDQILNKLNEAHGDVESAIEKILSAKGGSTPRPTVCNFFKFLKISKNYSKSSEKSKLIYIMSPYIYYNQIYCRNAFSE
jgi:hypothetical protein